MAEQKAQPKATSTASESSKSGNVQIFNHTSRMLSVGLRINAGDAKNVRIKLVSFLPGNNTVDAALWADCKKSKQVQLWMSRITHVDRVGRPFKTRFLEEGLHDEDFASEAADLGVRMQEISEAKRGKA